VTRARGYRGARAMRGDIGRDEGSTFEAAFAAAARVGFCAETRSIAAPKFLCGGL